MEWYVIVALVIILLIISSRVRVLALLACSSLIVMGSAYYFYSQYVEISSKKLIPISDIEIRDIALNLTSYNNYKIMGRINNKSPDYTLTRVSLRIFMEDCAETETKDTDCKVIGDTLEDVYVYAPPQQTRDFNEYVYFFGSKTKPTGKLNWHYIVLHTHGE
jgi:hypothetical protein